MLASTVQFSRYGRTQPRDRRGTGMAGRSTQDWPDEETVARSLRTQQRTYGHSLVQHPFLRTPKRLLY